MSMVISKGMGRIALAIGEIVIKLPSFHNGQLYFIHGLLGNLNESERWNLHRHPQLAQVYHCGPLGLWLVMKRYRSIVRRTLTTAERDTMPFVGIDNNAANVAIDDGKFILFDYGNVGWYYVEPSNYLDDSDTSA